MGWSGYRRGAGVLHLLRPEAALPPRLPPPPPREAQGRVQGRQRVERTGAAGLLRPGGGTEVLPSGAVYNFIFSNSTIFYHF